MTTSWIPATPFPAPLAECGRCHRKTWTPSEVGQEDRLPQPDGYPCGGRFTGQPSPHHTRIAAILGHVWDTAAAAVADETLFEEEYEHRRRDTLALAAMRTLVEVLRAWQADPGTRPAVTAITDWLTTAGWRPPADEAETHTKINFKPAP